MKTKMLRAKWLMIGLLATATLATAACDRSQPDDQAAAVPAEQEAAPAAEGEAAQAEEGAEAGAAAAEGAEGEQAGVSPPEIGKPAPDFTLVDEAGNSHKLSDYRGKTVVLEWFNMECPYVVRHYQEKTFDNTIAAADMGDDLVWLAIDSSHNHTADTTKEWKQGPGAGRAVDYPVLQDADGTVGRLYDAKTSPHMFVIDPQGIVRYMGAIDDDPRGRSETRQNYVIDALNALKAGEAVSTTTTTPYGCTVKYEGVN